MKPSRRQLKRFGVTIFFVFFVLAMLHAGIPDAYAQRCDTTDINGIKNCLQQTGKSSGFSTLDLITIVGNIIKIILGILGVIFVTLTIYAGFVWMVARGDSKEVERGRNMIIQSTIGLTIVLTAYTLTYFIVDQLQRAVGITQ